MLKTLLKQLTPPVFIALYLRTRTLFQGPNTLFDGDDSLFKEIVNGATVYGEYGCGKSTKWVLNNTQIKVIAVDTSAAWVDAVRNDNVQNNERLTIHHADLGNVGSWGRPINYAKRAKFPTYTEFLWTQDVAPDVVLIDGRFRVCCFLTSLLRAAAGTRIIFDDYTNRTQYHVVETYVTRTKTCGRQCLFIVPPKDDLNLAAIEYEIAAFRNVMD